MLIECPQGLVDGGLVPDHQLGLHQRRLDALLSVVEPAEGDRDGSLALLWRVKVAGGGGAAAAAPARRRLQRDTLLLDRRRTQLNE